MVTLRGPAAALLLGGAVIGVTSFAWRLGRGRDLFGQALAVAPRRGC